MVTLADADRVPGPIALQLHYSLVERNIEWEHLPAAREFGIGVLPWSPLAGGFLTGKYRREDRDPNAQVLSPELPDTGRTGTTHSAATTAG